MLRALCETLIAGVVTNRDFLIASLQRPKFIAGAATTAFIGAEAVPTAAAAPEALALAALLYVENGGAAAPSPLWRRATLQLEANGATTAVSIRREGETWIAATGDETINLRLTSRDANRVSYVRGDLESVATYALCGDQLKLLLGDASYDFVDRTFAPPRRDGDEAGGAVRSPVSGVIVAVDAQTGDRVKRGQALATVEAMKMQYAILAPIDGVIANAFASAGAQVSARTLLFEIEAPGGASDG